LSADGTQNIATRPGSRTLQAILKMTHPSCISILTITFCLTIALTSCRQTHNKKNEQKSANSKSLQADTSKTAIISFDKKRNYPFDNWFKPTTLTHDDLNSIETLLIACVTEYNNSLDKDHKEWSIDLKKYNYRKQIIAVANKKGDKEVWVNCFCNTRGSDKWKTEIMMVHDGGNCYFNFKVNLSTKKFYELTVNGEA
jgi:hypothetical protein